MRHEPLMPICVRSQRFSPAALRKVQIKYFARRSRCSSVSPGSSAARSWSGSRSLGVRILTAETQRPTMAGARPRRVTSTSGSSGMNQGAAGKYECLAFYCRSLFHAAPALSLRELARIEMLQSIKKGWEHNGSVHLIGEILSAHLQALRLKFADKV